MKIEKHPINRIQKRWNILFTDTKNFFRIHLEVMMYDNIPDSHHIFPRYLMVIREKLSLSYLIQILYALADSR